MSNAHLSNQDTDPPRDVLKELCDLLRENGEKVLSGESKLSLTTNCLHILNEQFSNISEEDFTTSFEVLPANSPKLPKYQDLQFLYDFVQKTVGLKLIHGSATLRGRISLAAFKSLRTLELKKTPLHMVEDINKHRAKLTTLICTRCMKQLQDLLEACGGDMAAPMSWQHVHTACFSYNCFTKLDSSLRLLPVLEVLDLSHNSIKSAENFLEYLTDIQVVSLSYNQLVSVPVFSLSGRNKLQILLLRNNNLDSLEGLEELTGLRELDLANNCLSDHSELEPLKELPRLNKLDLEGNPIWYHTHHRIYTLENVHPLALGRLVLDGKTVSEQEALYCRRFHQLTSSSWANLSLQPETSRRLPHVSSASSFDLDSSTQIDDESLSGRPRSGRSAARRRSSLKRGSRRARKPPVISDISDGDDLMADNSSEASYSTTPRDESHMDMKQTLEKARETLGPNWLQYLVHSKASSASSAAPGQRRLDLARDAIPPPDATDDDIFLNAEENPVVVLEDQTQNGQPEDATQEAMTSGETSGITAAASAVPETRKERLESSHSDTLINWRDNSAEHDVDYGLESEPFIVFDPDDPQQTQLLVTVSERYVLEKDLDGELTELLDLKCLQTLTNTEEMVCSVAMEGTPVELHVIRLTFDYVKKNRRERAYVMEDPASAEEFEHLLAPALNKNVAEEKRKETMHCLRCGRDFSKAEAAIDSKEDMQPKSGSYVPSQDKDEACMLCPFCGGGMIIQAEEPTPVDAGGGSNFATPIGSYSLPAPCPPLSPQKHSTPSKRNIDDETSITSSSFKSIPDSSIASSTFNTIINNISQASGRTDSAALAPNSSEASFDVLDSSRTDSPLSHGLHQSSSASKVSDRVQNGGEGTWLLSHLQKRKSESSAVSRKRQDSACSNGSDIVVLKRNSQTESEITLLSNPSQSSITVLEHESIYSRHAEPVTFTLAGEPLPGATSQLQPVMEGAGNHSPSGSLTNKTLNSMVSSMYEKSLPNDNASNCSDTSPHKGHVRTPSNESFQSVSSQRDTSSGAKQDTSTSITSNTNLRLQPNATQDASGIYSSTPTPSIGSNSSEDDASRFWRHDNCAHVDHRLKLYLTMSVFSADHEEFELILKCGCVLYNKGEEFPCLLVVSSSKVYIFKITGQERGGQFEKWLRLQQTHALTALLGVDVGLGHHSFRLDFGDVASFTFLVRDERRCKAFLRPLTDVLMSERGTTGSGFEGILKHNSRTQQNLESQVLCVDTADEEMDETVLKFCLCFLHTGQLDSKGLKSLRAVSVLVTPSHVFLLDENFCWPLPRAVATAAAAGKSKQHPSQPQFEIRDRQRVNDITSVDLYQTAPCEASLRFLDEATNEESAWRVAMETEEALAALVGALQQPWEAQFGVELQINMVPPSSS